MKKLCSLCLSLLLTLVLVLSPLTASAAYTPPDEVSEKIHARSALLLYLGDTAEHDMVLYEREADVRRSPSATVRVMVGLYAVREARARNLDLDTATGVYDMACNNVITGTGLGVVGMQIGDEWTLRDLLTASLAETAADACVALCQALCGSVSAFVDGMNALAKELGCTSTSFANVTGLDAMGQYTTARDLAKITRAAMEYPELVTMMGTASYTVHPVKGAEQTRASVNSMLRPITDSYYPKLQFGRTGYADEAGRCMVSVAKDGGYQFMAVVLGCTAADGSDRAIAHFETSQELFEWGFSGFTYKTLLSAGQPVGQLSVSLAWSTDTVPLVAEQSFGTVVPNDLDAGTVMLKPILKTDKAVDAPIVKGDTYGTVELYINLDEKIGEVPIVAGASVERSEVLAVWRVVQGVLTSVWFYLALGLLVVLILAYIVLNIIHNRQKRRRRR